MSAVRGVKWLAAWVLGLGLAASANAQTTVRYVHTDSLGSVVALTDQNRVVVERREYEPYGQQLTPAVADGPGYTGHVQDAASGLTYMQQRYYDPIPGLFLSVDPVTPNLETGASFNRYRYVAGNPYKYTDPDGRQEFNGNSRIMPKPRPEDLEPEIGQAPQSPTPSSGTQVVTTAQSVRGELPSAGGTPENNQVQLSSQDKYALRHVMGESVEDVKVYANSPLAQLYGATATTLKNSIFLSGDGASFLEDPELMLEEYYHVTKQWNTGDMTMLGYLLENATNGSGYAGNSYELEAKQFAEDHRVELQYRRGR